MYGHPAKIGPIMNIAKGEDLKVIKDASHSHGAEYRGEKTGVTR